MGHSEAPEHALSSTSTAGWKQIKYPGLMVHSLVGLLRTEGVADDVCFHGHCSRSPRHLHTLCTPSPISVGRFLPLLAVRGICPEGQHPACRAEAAPLKSFGRGNENSQACASTRASTSGTKTPRDSFISAGPLQSMRREPPASLTWL